MQHIFIVNPTAGKTDATKHIAKAVNQLFMNHEIEGTYRIEATQSPGHATSIAKKYAQSNQPVTLYACGGDGTLNEVLHGIIGYENVILAHIPCGSGNDFIKAFGEPAKEDFNNIASLIKGKTVRIDVIQVNDHYSINVANVGLDATIAFNVVNYKKLPLINGKRAYQLSLATSFFTSTKHDIEVLVDGKKEKEDCFTFVVAANGKYYGGSYCVAPLSDMQDGLLDIILVPKISRIKILQFMNIYQKGEHLADKYSDMIHFKRAKKIELISSHPLKVCIDGEAVEYTNPVIQVLPSAIKFLVPAKYCNQDKLI